MSLSERDRKVIWHPYTQMKGASLPIAISRGEGVYLFDEKGKSYIDAISSWWVNVHGHSHPYIAQKAFEQLSKLDHVIFAGFTHEPAVVLAERLLKLLPSFNKIFYSDNGSTAVEVALKMSFQYWSNRGECRKKVIALKNSYHGDTFGAMSVSSRGAFTKPFDNFLFDVEFIDAPFTGEEEASISQFKRIIENEGDNLAAFIFEPLVMGAGGMLMYEAEGLDKLLRICKENKILTIADEVMTGFGRTGKMFATEFLVTQPDLICLSKGITGGTIALGVTACSEDIYNAFLSDDPLQTFFHGHSYTANPLTCAIALANLDLFEINKSLNNIRRISNKHAIFISNIKGSSKISNLRHTGTILAFDLKTGEETSYFNKSKKEIENFFLKDGILIRPLGNTIYLMPPYIITDEELDRVYSSIKMFLGH